MGFSLGGNVVAKWLGERGDDLPPEVRAGAVISAPWDLGRCADAIDGSGGMALLYRERFLRTLRHKALASSALPRAPLRRQAEVRACRTFAAFDDRVTSRLHGFDGARDYWERCSAGASPPASGGRSSPSPRRTTPSSRATRCRSRPRAPTRPSRLETYPAGGHVGFVSGRPWRFEFFAEARAAAFLAAALRR